MWATHLVTKKIDSENVRWKCKAREDEKLI